MKFCVGKKTKRKVKNSGVFGYTSHGGEGAPGRTSLVSHRMGSWDSGKALPIHPTEVPRITNESTAKLNNQQRAADSQLKGTLLPAKTRASSDIQADLKIFYLKTVMPGLDKALLVKLACLFK